MRRADTCLAVATHASNVTGVVLPLAGMAAAVNDAGLRLVVDASQTAGHLPLSLPGMEAAAVAMPGHKGLLGPSGTGLLYLTPGVEVEPLIRGGTGSLSELEVQPDFAPDRYESGTLNAMGIVGLGAAAAWLAETGIDGLHASATALGQRFRDGLAGIDGIAFYGSPDPADSVGIASVNVAGVPCATAARVLDDEWAVMTRAGLHCSPAAHRSLGTAPEGTIRFSWGYDTTEADIDAALVALRTIADRARTAEPVGSRA